MTLLFILWQSFGLDGILPPARATGEKMVLLWDTALGGTVPTGWTNASATYGGYFLRGDTVANVGVTNVGTHNHTSGTVAFQAQSTPVVTAKNNKSTEPITVSPHGHNISSFTMDDATILPVYKNLIAITYDSGIPATIPQYAIALFDSEPGAMAGWSNYSTQNGNMIRIDSTSGGTGGATTHTHANFQIDSDLPNATQLVTGGSGSTASSDIHTHTYGPTNSPASTDHTPLHTEVILGYPTSGSVSIPSGMIAMFNGDPNIDSSGWNIISDASEAFGGVYIEAQSSYLTGQGNATHSHALSVSSTTHTPVTIYQSGPPTLNGIGAHAHTISGDFSTENNTPPYINVVVAKKAANLGVSAVSDVALTTGSPSETTETTFDTDELVTVTDGGDGWSLTVVMQSTLSDGGSNTIPDANVYIRKDGNVAGGSDILTIWSGTTTNVSETNETVSLDTTRTVGTRSAGTGGDETTVRPSIRVIIPPLQATGDYTGTLRFTVA